MKNIDKKIGIIQLKIIELLNKFMYGDTLSKASRYLYPIVERHLIKEMLIDELIENIIDIKKNRAKSFEKSLKILQKIRFNKYCSASYVCKIICSLYEELEQEVNSYNIKTIKIKVNKFDRKYYSKKSELEPIVQLSNYINKELKDDLLEFLIHGSYSTLDYVKRSSDLDTLLIIKKDIIKNVDRLYKFKKRIYRTIKYLWLMDPYQHHGHFTITEIDLKYYPQSFFPIILFNYSKSLLNKNNNLYICPIEDKMNLFTNFMKIYNRVKKGKNKKDGFKNLYEFKSYLHYAMLIPTIFIELTNNFIYKKYSFYHIKKYRFKKAEIIDKATKIRSIWKSKYLLSFRLDFAISKIIHYFLLQKVYLTIHNDIPKEYVRIIGKDYYQDFFKLLEEMKGRL